MIDFAKLTAPFPPERVSWRVGSTTQDKKRGMALAYIDARDVMGRLDEVCGPAGWQCRYPHANGKTVCEIGIHIAIPDVGWQWIWKADGAGDTDFEAEKGALSDAFKRAAVRWGIGRYLYDTPAPWVEIEQHGKSYSIPDRELARLGKLLGATAAPEPPKQPSPAPKMAAFALPDGVVATEWSERTVAIIDGHDDGKELRAWWSANVSGKIPAAVTQEQFEKVKAHCIARIGKLEGRKAA